MAYAMIHFDGRQSKTSGDRTGLFSSLWQNGFRSNSWSNWRLRSTTYAWEV